MCSDGDALEQLDRALDALAEDAAVLGGGGDEVRALHCALTRLEAVTTRACAAFDRSGRWPGTSEPDRVL